MQLVGTLIDTSSLIVEAATSPGIVDVTDDVGQRVAATGAESGLVLVYCRHTTCGVLINELEDGLAEDFRAATAALVPNGYFAHDDLSRRTQNLQGADEPANGAAHVKQMLFGATSQLIPITGGAVALGRWQRILFVELDEPRPRELLITIVAV